MPSSDSKFSGARSQVRSSIFFMYGDATSLASTTSWRRGMSRVGSLRKSPSISDGSRLASSAEAVRVPPLSTATRFRTVSGDLPQTAACGSSTKLSPGIASLDQWYRRAIDVASLIPCWITHHSPAVVNANAWWYSWNPSCTAALSTFADIRLAYTSGAGSIDASSHAAAISAGALRDVAPLPPATKKPKSDSAPRMPSFRAPQTVVVTPLECQSKPSTHPNAWNQNGSDSRRSISPAPCSATTCPAISRERRTMRPKSQGGAFPPCNGRCAKPVRPIDNLAARTTRGAIRISAFLNREERLNAKGLEDRGAHSALRRRRRRSVRRVRRDHRDSEVRAREARAQGAGHAGARRAREEVRHAPLRQLPHGPDDGKADGQEDR